MAANGGELGRSPCGASSRTSLAHIPATAADPAQGGRETGLGRACSRLAIAIRVRVVPDAQAVFCRRRHQLRRPPLARIRPGRPAPRMGPGTTNADEFAVMMIGKLLSGMKGTNSATM